MQKRGKCGADFRDRARRVVRNPHDDAVHASVEDLGLHVIRKRRGASCESYASQGFWYIARFDVLTEGHDHGTSFKRGWIATDLFALAAQDIQLGRQLVHRRPDIEVIKVLDSKGEGFLLPTSADKQRNVLT